MRTVDAFRHRRSFRPDPRLSLGLGLSLSLAILAGVTGNAAPQPAETNAAAMAMMQDFLRREAVRMDADPFDGATDARSWEARRTARREQYLEMLGLWPLPERTPLNPVVTSTVVREEGFRVETLHFQSRPRLYVTGNLYLPRDAAPGAKLPAVLYVCGHSGRGRDGNKTAFQQHGMWFATHGYACLIIDTLQLGEIGAIHHGTYRHDRWWWQARGYTPAGVECWNGIRAIDYLTARPEVDPGRIAVTGISGGGAATFWIAAADERVQVAVPVSGMSDLEDYVGNKVVNGHCDCMFLFNTFQWPWTRIAALIAPRPLLFENSGHDTIFPMTGNDRIRGRLETLYGFYTNRTDRLFDIGVTPGGHDDKVELRLMAYRWINRFLKNDDRPVTEPDLPPIEAQRLRAFRGELPADELNTRIDEVFVAAASQTLPSSAKDLPSWRAQKLAELGRIVFRGLTDRLDRRSQLTIRERPAGTGTLVSEAGIHIPWTHFPPKSAARTGPRTRWLAVLDETDAPASQQTKPEWLAGVAGDDAVLVVSPRGCGALRWADPAPHYIRRSLALLGRTLDDCRLADVVAAAAQAINADPDASWNLVGRGNAGVIAAYAALLEPRIAGVTAIEPPASHRGGPVFPNVLRVLDVPEAFGLLAPRPLQLDTSAPESFASTRQLYELAGARLKTGKATP